jgi:hypothetical protein
MSLLVFLTLRALLKSGFVSLLSKTNTEISQSDVYAEIGTCPARKKFYVSHAALCKMCLSYKKILMFKKDIPSGFLYRTHTQLKINFDHQFLPIKKLDIYQQIYIVGFIFKRDFQWYNFYGV